MALQDRAFGSKGLRFVRPTSKLTCRDEAQRNGGQVQYLVGRLNLQPSLWFMMAS
jgi:hypothetical protein